MSASKFQSQRGSLRAREGEEEETHCEDGTVHDDLSRGSRLEHLVDRSVQIEVVLGGKGSSGGCRINDAGEVAPRLVEGVLGVSPADCACGGRARQLVAPL